MQFKQFQKGSLKNFCSGFDGIRTHAPLDTSWALKPTELQSHTFGDMHDMRSESPEGKKKALKFALLLTFSSVSQLIEAPDLIVSETCGRESRRSPNVFLKFVYLQLQEFSQRISFE